MKAGARLARLVFDIGSAWRLSRHVSQAHRCLASQLGTSLALVDFLTLVV
jgi:hypothetical protein